jgi:NADH dehydrogenase FAD-containing subunit
MTERIAIVGGGTGGTVLANDLAGRLSEELDAGLGEGGWADVDPHTPEIHGVEKLYALGDVAATGVPKAGSAAHYQAKTLAKRIADHVRGRPSTAR